jgi:hypothetical protein
VEAIKDAENLLAHFDTLNSRPPPPENEVLKRAGLIMAMTAWETYVEDCVQEAAQMRLSTVTDRSIADFVAARLNEEIKRLHNPSAEKTLQLFRDYAGVSVTEHWAWNHVGPEQAKRRLNDYLKLRGDVVHRARTGAASAAHPVTKDDLHKAIYFLKELVKATERALAAAATDATDAKDAAHPKP